MPYLLILLIACFGNHVISAQSLNPDFGHSGRSMVNFFERTNDDYNAVSISIGNDNHLILGGDVYNESVIHKIKPDGDDDLNFAHKGFSFFDFGLGGGNRIEETLTDPNGRILGIGHSTPNSSLVNRYNATSAAIAIRLLPNGEPDTSFGQKGKALYIHNHLSLRAFTGVVQTDGKIIVACRGNTQVNATTVWDRIMLVRFTSQGLVDSSFGTNGGFVVPKFSTWSIFYSGDMGLALQPDGKILLADIWSEPIFTTGLTTKASPAVYRVTTQGRLDSSFAVNGMFANRFGYDNLALNSVLVQPDGKIVIAGNTKTTTNTSSWVMFRLKTSGEVDSSFATNGLFTYTRSTWVQQSIGHIQMQGNDHIIAAGFHNNSTQGVLDVFRLKLNGTVDSSFAQNTVIYHQLMRNTYFFNGAKLALDANQGIAAIGYGTHFPSPNPNNKGHLVARLSKDGLPLAGFHTIGYRIYYNTQDLNATTDYNHGSTDRFGGLARLSSGKIMLAGTVYRYNETKKEIGVTRLLQSGKIDSSFGLNGRKTYPEIPYFTRIRAFLHLQDDWLLMNINENTILKIDSTGTPDPLFGTNGLVKLNLPDINGFAPTIKGVAQQRDKKILVITEKQMVRFNTDGSVDNSFGSSGIVTMSNSFGIEAMMIKVQPDGKIVVGADAGTNFLFRCLPNGTPDNSFGLGNGYGSVNTPSTFLYEPPYNSRFIDFEIQEDGKMVVLCMKDRAYGVPNSTAYSNYRDITLFRLTAAGLIDNTFGGIPHTTGYAGTAHHPLPFSEEVPGDLLLTPEGKLLIAGYFSNGTGWDVGLVQLKNNGQYDTTCTIRAFTTAAMDNVIQNRFFGNNLSLKMVPGANGTYLVGGTQMAQGADYFVVNFLAPSSPIVNYTLFNATKDTACFGVNLAWRTDYECTVDSFFVEYSRDGNSFTKIGSVNAIGGSLNAYAFTHQQAAFGNNYYRLRLYSKGSTYSIGSVKNVSIANTPITVIDWKNTIITDRDSLFDAELHWRTQFEQASTVFEVQISTDSLNFTTVKSLSGAGNSSVPQLYTTTVRGLPAGKYYFRIKILGINCRQIESSVIGLLFEKGCKDNFTVTPNPVRSILKVNIPSCEKGDIRIVNMLGQIVKIIKNVDQPQIEINCSAFAAATYIIQFFGEKVYTVKFLKL